MGQTTNTLGGAAILLAQAFPAAAEGAFPVSAECAKRALETVYYLTSDTKSSIITETLPDRVITLSQELAGADTNRYLDLSATIMIDEQGFLSSIQTNSNIGEGLGGNMSSATAQLTYSPERRELSASPSPLSNSGELIGHIQTTIAVSFANNLERKMRECDSAFYLSKAQPTLPRLG